MALIAEDRVEDEAVARAIRAQVQYQDFFFVKFDDHIRCSSFNSGKEYRIVNGSCNCPDAVYRAHPAGIRCKHECALEMAEAAGECN